ncbi:hypothetical protein D9M68_841720 [compost metagenome]
MDLARDVGALLFDAGLQVLGQLGQALARFGQFIRGPRALAPRLRHLDRLLDHVREAVHAVLEQIVAHTAVHRIHRRRLADGAGEDDERNLDPHLAHHVPGIHAGEAGQVVVGQHHVEAPAQQFAAEIVQRVDQHHLAGQLAALQGELHQRVVHARIFQMQDVNRWFVEVLGHAWWNVGVSGSAGVARWLVAATGQLGKWC